MNGNWALVPCNAGINEFPDFELVVKFDVKSDVNEIASTALILHRQHHRLRSQC
ncbi:hypothetical protein [Nostoc sp.]|uniref:hypothetical protein n=1 Tax=Nostoc sp. TaxID=1180 RepID=UPI003FA5D287